MKEKFLAFFTGKAGKAAYMIAASAAVCAVAVVSTVVVVHNNNQKLNTALESLSALTSQSESESVTEPSTEAEQTQAVSAQAANGSSGGSKQEGKAIQYLAEYNRLTEEYEKKREELMENYPTVTAIRSKLTKKPERITVVNDPSWQESLDQEYESRLSVWESESAAYSEDVSRKEKANQEAERLANEINQKVSDLDTQYKKDVEALKQRYGIK